MIKVSVLYPNSPDDNFNLTYYRDNHIPMVQGKLGAACKKITVEQGLSGAMPGSDATYIVMGNLYFDSIENFQSAFGPHAEAIMNDIPNYTNQQPVIQISEVII